MNNKNIMFNHTLEQYNKKYRNRTHRLIKYTKKQVEEFDKQYGHYTYNGKTYSLEFSNYLLKDRKWWFTKEDECYHEIPRPVRFTWFRNLNAGVQIATCALLAGAVAGSTVAITQKIIYDLDDSIVLISDSTGKVELKKQEDDKQADAQVYVLATKTNDIEITDVKVKKGNTDLIKGEDYIYDDASSKLYVYNDVVEKKKITGKIDITPVIANAKKDTTQSNWLVEYKKYSDRFQGIEESQNIELKQYDINDITLEGFYFNSKGAKTKPVFLKSRPIKYSTTGARNVELQFVNPDNPKDLYKKSMGGGKFAHSNIVEQIFKPLIKEEGCTIEYIIGDNFLKYNAYKNNKLFSSVKFNPNGYIENTYASDSPGATQFFVKYNGDPTLENKYLYEPTNAKLDQQKMQCYYYFETIAATYNQNEITFLKDTFYTFSSTISGGQAQSKTITYHINSLEFDTTITQIIDVIDVNTIKVYLNGEELTHKQPSTNEKKIELDDNEYLKETPKSNLQFTFKVSNTFTAKVSTIGAISIK